ncbi:MAG: riboflavin biosynthesis protein RibF [Opitutae bacterium]
MSTLLPFDRLEQASRLTGPLHLAIGMFDGLHRGHQTVISAALAAARRGGGQAGVLTFWPHPSALFRPAQPTRLLMPPAMKRAVLGRLGLDFVIEQNFSPEFAAIEARDFPAYLRHGLPSLAAVYVGENWRYGRGRSGTVTQLIAEAPPAGFSVFSAPRLNHGGAPISSSRIRELLVAGDITAANALLGFAYFSTGTVQPGRQLGRTIGFPTLNLAWDPELAPRLGVYAVQVTTAAGAVLPGVANYGVRPTVDAGTRPLLEVHLLEDSAVTYGDVLTVSWLQFLRPESKFNGVQELQAQIALDRESAREFFRVKGGTA